MRADPLPPMPSQIPAGPAPAVGGPSAQRIVRSAPSGSAANGGLVGVVPEVIVDHQAARDLKRQVGEQLLARAQDEPGAGRRRPREQRARALINEAVSVWADAAQASRQVPRGEEQALAELVFDMLFRAGRLQRHLDDDRVENILINGHDQVFLDFGDDHLVQVAAGRGLRGGAQGAGAGSGAQQRPGRADPVHRQPLSRCGWRTGPGCRPCAR